jgi:hypothetical protein
LTDSGVRQDVFYIGKAFQAQKLFGEILRRNAGAVDLRKSNGGCFQRRFLAKRARGTDEACCTRRRERGKESAAIL